MCLGPKTLHYAKLWAQNATKTSAGNIPESLSNLFLRDNCRSLQRLLNNANKRAHISGRKKAHKHKLFALVNVQMALGQTAGCPRVNLAKKFMCSPRNTGNIHFSLWLTGGLSQGCPDFQKVYVFKVYVPFSCPNIFTVSLGMATL